MNGFTRTREKRRGFSPFIEARPFSFPRGGVIRFLGGLFPSMSKEINKKFLHGTLSSVMQHNRREEIADCWREHEMQALVSSSSSSSSSAALPTGTSNKRTATTTASDDERERMLWAERKASKFAAVTSTKLEQSSSVKVQKVNENKESDSSDDSSSSEVEQTKKKRKKEKKEEAKKKAKKKEKKEKRKKDKKKKKHKDS